MGKFKSDDEEALRIAFSLENFEDSFENLIEHKQTIKSLIGRVNELEDKNYKQELKYEELRKNINRVLY